MKTFTNLNGLNSNNNSDSNMVMTINNIESNERVLTDIIREGF